MNRFADAYERALLPMRRRDAGEWDGVPDALDVAVGAGWYRLVCAVEALIESLSAAARHLRSRPEPRRSGSGPAPIGCG